MNKSKHITLEQGEEEPLAAAEGIFNGCMIVSLLFWLPLLIWIVFK